VFLRLSEPNHLDWRLAARFLQPYIDKIQLEHTQQCVEQGMNNLGWLTTAPHGWKSEGADQIINAALKVRDLLCKISGLYIHISGRRGRITPTSSPLAKFSQELIRRHKERILLKDAADDNHGMRSHDVNHRVTPKATEMVSTDDRVVVTKPHVVYTRLELNHVIDMRPIFNRPVHATTNAAQRKSSLGVSAGQLLKYLQHPILIVDDRVTCAGFTGWPRYKMISSSFRSGSSMYSENSRTLALHSRRSALQNSVGNQDKLSQPTRILIYPEGRVCSGECTVPHSDTKVLPIPSSSCFMVSAVPNPDLCIEFGAKIR
jgi:hypothetical protein